MKLSRLLAGATALAVTIGVGAAIPGHAATAPDSWVATATKAQVATGLTPAGVVAPSAPLRVTVALRERNQAQLQAFLRNVATPGNPAYHQWLTPEQFAQQFSPSESDASAVVDYLHAQGFSNVSVEPNRLLVSAEGTVATAAAAFHTAFAAYRLNGTVVRVNTLPASVPARLGSTVGAVLGLSELGVMHGTATPASKPAAGQADCELVPDTGLGCSRTAQDFWKAYDAGSTPAATATSIAIIAQGNLDPVLTDLTQARKDQKLPELPTSGKHQAVFPVYAGLRSKDTAGLDEWDMDTQTSTGIAGTVKSLYIYAATTLADSDLALPISRWVTDNKAQAASASLGECDYQAWLDGAEYAYDQLFNQAAAQGQTFFASSGDTGGFCPVGAAVNGVPAGAPDTSYPASSPYAIAVGGTTLLTNDDGTYNQEAAWLAGGGGPSSFEQPSSWQTGTALTIPSCNNPLGAYCGRAVPDIAMDADPNTGADVVVGGEHTTIGGTSLSSPLSLGVWARLLTARPGLGMAGPQLYRPEVVATLHDVTTGDTGPWPATPGYDYATGLGSFDIAAANKALATLPVEPAPTLTKPACTVVSDETGDSAPIGSSGNVDSLDIRAAGFRPGADGKSLEAELLVESLSDGPGGLPQVAGTGDDWYVRWTVGGTQYFASASYPDPTGGTVPDPSNPAAALFTFGYGTVDVSPTGGTLYNNVGSTTGTVDVAKGVITIDVPLSATGSPAAGTALTATGANTFESIGVPGVGGLLETADVAGPGSSYKIGGTC